MEDLVRFGVSMHAQLLERFDAAIARRGYASRSEAIRDLVRHELVQEQWEQRAGEVTGTVTLVYDHHSSHVNQALTELQHSHLSVIVATLHVHLDAHNCLEVIVLRGPAPEVRKVADVLASLKDARLGRLAIATADA